MRAHLEEKEANEVLLGLVVEAHLEEEELVELLGLASVGFHLVGMAWKEWLGLAPVGFQVVGMRGRSGLDQRRLDSRWLEWLATPRLPVMELVAVGSAGQVRVSNISVTPSAKAPIAF